MSRTIFTQRGMLFAQNSLVSIQIIREIYDCLHNHRSDGRYPAGVNANDSSLQLIDLTGELPEVCPQLPPTQPINMP